MVMTAACKPVIDTITPTSTKTDQPIIIESESSWTYHASFPELTYYSDIIVIARPISVGDIVNSARDVTDVSKPDPNRFSITAVYKMKVEDYLVGDGPETILVGQNLGSISQTGERTPTPKEIRRVTLDNRDNSYTPIRSGNRYLLFLDGHRGEDYVIDGFQTSYNASDLYSVLLPPRVFNLNDPNCVYPELPTEGYNPSFRPMPLAQILEEIEKPFDPQDPAASIPYPAPRISEDCLYLTVTPPAYPLPYPAP